MNTMEEIEMPSKVLDKKHIQIPEGQVVDSDEEWAKCGKWVLIHPYADFEFVDSAWVALQQILDDGTLLMLKSSTAKMATVGGTILCFTRSGKQEARRAARAIRRVVDFKGIMHYKLNETTSQGIANRFGSKRVSMYMYTYSGGFYTKKNNAWIQDDEDSEEKSTVMDKKFLKESYSGDENLPSTHQERCFWNVPETHKCSRGYDWWCLFCSCEDEGPHLPDVDRVWLVAQQLLQEGLFEGLFLGKYEDAKFAEMRLYVSRDCDVYSRLAACDRLLKEASCRGVMYFTKSKRTRLSRGGQNGPLHDFIYTSDGDLYEKTEHSEVYLSGRGKE